MKEIKFRGYSKEAKKWIFGNYTHCENSIHIVAFFRKAKGNHLKHISQFTGLKDKEGKEIYEGDIVKFVPKFSKRVGVAAKEYESKVYFAGGCFRVKYLSQGLALSDCLNIKIVGNIYES